MAQTKRAERIRCAVLNGDATARTAAAAKREAEDHRKLLAKRVQGENSQQQLAAAQTGHFMALGDKIA